MELTFMEKEALKDALIDRNLFEKVKQVIEKSDEVQLLPPDSFINEFGAFIIDV